MTASSSLDSELFGTYTIANAGHTAKGTELVATETLAKLLNESWSPEGESQNTGPLLGVTSCSKIYDGNSSNGWKGQSSGFIKTGTASVKGKMDFEFSVEVAKVVISCHTWNARNATMPSYDTVAVNGFAAKQASMDPDNYGDLVFNLFPSNEVSIVTTCRVFIESIAIYVPTAAD